MATLQSSVREVHGIGPKKAASLATLGVATLADALLLYPRDYEDRTHIVPVSQALDGQRSAIYAVVGSRPVVKRMKRGMELTKACAFDESGTFELVFFNNRYVAAQLHEGKSYLFYGRIQVHRAHVQMISPVFEPSTGDVPKGRIVPVYPLAAGLTQHDILRITDAALRFVDHDMIDPLPEYLRHKYNFKPLSSSLQTLHRPCSLNEVTAARRRLVFEELFLLCCGLLHLEKRRKDKLGLRFSQGDLTLFRQTLGFSLTAAQQRAVADIIQDVCSGRPMNRLLQGDVGSGKTAVAAALCVLTVQNGYQIAIMAPTEILAEQHYEALSSLFHKLEIPCELLTGSIGVAAKREIKARLADGTSKVVIGTHALIQADVSFYNLGAVIVDEQHRFGVSQRASLSAKGDTPHILVMSATPIPRTLALLMYGDLDVSILDELPPGRTPVQSFAVGEHMRERVYRFAEKQCAEGGQIYVVCPLVEQGERRSAEQHVAALRRILPKRKIALLHGRMKPAEKASVMSSFASAQIDILVSTTVIEVGVNVPNATLMIIEDADCFGLSQLHQLRGRVGRGKRQSYCIFFGVDKGEKARARLKLLCHTLDGFEIARADLAQRGPGDFFGARQHGIPPLHLADLAQDLTLLQDAQHEAAALLQKDTDLESYPELRKRVCKMFYSTVQGDIFN